MSWCVAHKLEQPCWKCLEISRIEKAPLKPADAAEWKALAQELSDELYALKRGLQIRKVSWSLSRAEELLTKAREMGLKVEERK